MSDEVKAVEVNGAIDKIALALSKAQKTIKPAVKDTLNPFFKHNYATLTSIWEAIRESFAENELSVVQSPTMLEDGRLVLISLLMHSSGQYIRSVYPIKPVKDDPQGVGSALTYARRYSLQSLAGVCAEEDDDGNAASRAGQQQAKPVQKQQYPKSGEPMVVAAPTTILNKPPENKLEETSGAPYPGNWNELRKAKVPGFDVCWNDPKKATEGFLKSQLKNGRKEAAYEIAFRRANQ